METKRIVTGDGTVAYYLELNDTNKLHNVDGPALIPQGNKRQSEYWLFGFKYSKTDWEDRKKDTNGVPWHKTAAGKAAGSRV